MRSKFSVVVLFALLGGSVYAGKSSDHGGGQFQATSARSVSPYECHNLRQLNYAFFEEEVDRPEEMVSHSYYSMTKEMSAAPALTIDNVNRMVAFVFRRCSSDYGFFDRGGRFRRWVDEKSNKEKYKETSSNFCAASYLRALDPIFDLKTDEFRQAWLEAISNGSRTKSSAKLLALVRELAKNPDYLFAKRSGLTPQQEEWRYDARVTLYLLNFDRHNKDQRTMAYCLTKDPKDPSHDYEQSQIDPVSLLVGTDASNRLKAAARTMKPPPFPSYSPDRGKSYFFADLPQIPPEATGVTEGVLPHEILATGLASFGSLPPFEQSGIRDLLSITGALATGKLTATANQHQMEENATRLQAELDRLEKSRVQEGDNAAAIKQLSAEKEKADARAAEAMGAELGWTNWEQNGRNQLVEWVNARLEDIADRRLDDGNDPNRRFAIRRVLSNLALSLTPSFQAIAGDIVPRAKGDPLGYMDSLLAPLAPPFSLELLFDHPGSQVSASIRHLLRDWVYRQPIFLSKTCAHDPQGMPKDARCRVQDVLTFIARAADEGSSLYTGNEKKSESPFKALDVNRETSAASHDRVLASAERDKATVTAQNQPKIQPFENIVERKLDSVLPTESRDALATLDRPSRDALQTLWSDMSQTSPGREQFLSFIKHPENLTPDRVQDLTVQWKPELSHLLDHPIGKAVEDEIVDELVQEAKEHKLGGKQRSPAEKKIDQLADETASSLTNQKLPTTAVDDLRVSIEMKLKKRAADQLLADRIEEAGRARRLPGRPYLTLDDIAANTKKNTLDEDPELISLLKPIYESQVRNNPRQAITDQFVREDKFAHEEHRQKALEQAVDARMKKGLSPHDVEELANEKILQDYQKGEASPTAPETTRAQTLAVLRNELLKCVDFLEAGQGKAFEQKRKLKLADANHALTLANKELASKNLTADGRSQLEAQIRDAETQARIWGGTIFPPMWRLHGPPGSNEIARRREEVVLEEARFERELTMPLKLANAKAVNLRIELDTISKSIAKEEQTLKNLSALPEYQVKQELQDSRGRMALYQGQLLDATDRYYRVLATTADYSSLVKPSADQPWIGQANQHLLKMTKAWFDEKSSEPPKALIQASASYFYRFRLAPMIDATQKYLAFRNIRFTQLNTEPDALSRNRRIAQEGGEALAKGLRNVLELQQKEAELNRQLATSGAQDNEASQREANAVDQYYDGLATACVNHINRTNKYDVLSRSYYPTMPTVKKALEAFQQRRDEARDLFAALTPPGGKVLDSNQIAQQSWYQNLVDDFTSGRHGFRMTPAQVEHMFEPMKAEAAQSRGERDNQIQFAMAPLQKYGILWDGSKLNYDAANLYGLDTPEKVKGLFANLDKLQNFGVYGNLHVKPSDQLIETIMAIYTSGKDFAAHFPFGKYTAVFLSDPSDSKGLSSLSPEKIREVYQHPELAIHFKNLREVEDKAQELLAVIQGRPEAKSDRDRGMKGLYNRYKRKIFYGINGRIYTPSSSWLAGLMGQKDGYTGTISDLNQTDRDMNYLVNGPMKNVIQELRKYGGNVPVSYADEQMPVSLVVDLLDSERQHGYVERDVPDFEKQMENDLWWQRANVGVQLALLALTKGPVALEGESLAGRMVGGASTGMLMNSGGQYLTHSMGTWMYGTDVTPTRWSNAGPSGLISGAQFAFLAPVGDAIALLKPALEPLGLGGPLATETVKGVGGMFATSAAADMAQGIPWKDTKWEALKSSVWGLPMKAIGYRIPKLGPLLKQSRLASGGFDYLTFATLGMVSTAEEAAKQGKYVPLHGDPIPVKSWWDAMTNKAIWKDAKIRSAAGDLIMSGQGMMGADAGKYETRIVRGESPEKLREEAKRSIVPIPGWRAYLEGSIKQGIKQIEGHDLGTLVARAKGDPSRPEVAAAREVLGELGSESGIGDWQKFAASFTSEGPKVRYLKHLPAAKIGLELKEKGQDTRIAEVEAGGKHGLKVQALVDDPLFREKDKFGRDKMSLAAWGKVPAALLARDGLTKARSWDKMTYQEQVSDPIGKLALDLGEDPDGLRAFLAAYHNPGKKTLSQLSQDYSSQDPDKLAKMVADGHLAMSDIRRVFPDRADRALIAKIRRLAEGPAPSLSDRVDLSVGDLGRIVTRVADAEQNRAKPAPQDLSSLQEIAGRLGMSPDSLIEGYLGWADARGPATAWTGKRLSDPDVTKELRKVGLDSLLNSFGDLSVPTTERTRRLNEALKLDIMKTPEALDRLPRRMLDLSRKDEAPLIPPGPGRRNQRAQREIASQPSPFNHPDHVAAVESAAEAMGVKSPPELVRWLARYRGPDKFSDAVHYFERRDPAMIDWLIQTGRLTRADAGKLYTAQELERATVSAR